MMAEAGNHSLKDFLREIIQLVFRSFPFPVESGLYRFGNSGQEIASCSSRATSSTRCAWSGRS